MCVECKEGKELTMEMRGIKKQESTGRLTTALKFGLVVFFFLQLTQQLYLLSMYDRRQIILLHNNTESEVVQLKRFN
jgi:hypothetical protein